MSIERPAWKMHQVCHLSRVEVTEKVQGQQVQDDRCTESEVDTWVGVEADGVMEAAAADVVAIAAYLAANVGSPVSEYRSRLSSPRSRYPNDEADFRLC